MAKTDVISLDLVQAMKAKDGLKVSTLRMLVAALKNSQIAKGGVLTDQEAEAVLGKEAKKDRKRLSCINKATGRSWWIKKLLN